jgi:hypothetical protein
MGNKPQTDISIDARAGIFDEVTADNVESLANDVNDGDSAEHADNPTP